MADPNTPVPFMPNERIVDMAGLASVQFVAKLNGLQQRVGVVLGGYVTAADFTTALATKQNHTANLDALSAATQTTFGLALLGEASATHLLGTTLNAYTKTETNSAIATALVPYLTSATAAATYQPIGSYVTYTAQTLTGPQQTQARSNIGAQVAGSYLTAVSASGDVSAPSTAGALVTTLATVNSNVGSFGSASQVATFTVNAKGLLTAAGNVTITPAGIGAQPAGTYATGTGTASGTNTGDETATTIRSKLGITTLSGSNTGDETATTIRSKLGITTLTGSNTGDQTISLTVPSIFTAGASSTSTLSFTVASQAANLVWASPNGASGAPTFRALVAADIPALPYAPTGSYEVTTNKGAANGYAPLDANGKVPYANVLWRYNAGGLDATNTIRYDDATTPRGGVFVHTAVLTAARTLNLSAVNAITGETWRIVRSMASTGSFVLNVTDLSGTVVLKSLNTGNWMDAVFNGTNWVLIGYGTL